MGHGLHCQISQFLSGETLVAQNRVCHDLKILGSGSSPAPLALLAADADCFVPLYDGLTVRGGGWQSLQRLP